jgi:hypothetical protein
LPASTTMAAFIFLFLLFARATFDVQSIRNVP